MAVISASILDADYSRLREEVEEVASAGIEAFSLDVMDGHFVPRVTFGAYVVGLVRTWITLPIEVHLMTEQPDKWMRRMCDAGADLILFHLEVTNDPDAIIEYVRSRDRGVGIAVKENTPLEAISDELLRRIDVVNLLSVPAGFGGNASAPNTFERIRALRERIETAAGARVAIEVDGGVKPETATTYVEAGADMLTVGTGIYRADEPARAVRTLVSTTRGQADSISRSRLQQFLAVPSLAASDLSGYKKRVHSLR